MKILVTGANGFIGSALCPYLSGLGHAVVPVVRRPCDLPHAKIIKLDEEAEWGPALGGCDCVIHLAGRAHVMRESEPDPLAAFRVANVDATMHLARRAFAAGVKRFIFVSSIKVNGEETAQDCHFRPDDLPRPKDAYAISKFEAEQALLSFAQKNKLEVVIIRPPLVYGPGARGNFERVLKWVARGIPLPLSAINNNRRSLVCLYNLNHLISTCIEHPSAANQIFLVSDGEDLSTSDLLVRTSRALGRKPRLFYVPTWMLKACTLIVNEPDLYLRLCCSLQLDITKNKELLKWLPPISVDEGLCRAVQKLLVRTGDAESCEENCK